MQPQATLNGRFSFLLEKTGAKTMPYLHVVQTDNVIYQETAKPLKTAKISELAVYKAWTLN